MWVGPVQPEREPLWRNSGGTAGAAPLVPKNRDEGAFFVPRGRGPCQRAKRAWEDVMAKTERKADHGDEALYALRHSAAHVMAGAVLELFPGAKFGFGPPIQDGFYYDFDLPRALTPDDLETIEAKMREVVKHDAPFKHGEMSVGDALKFFGERKQDYKVDQIKKLAADG